MLANRSATLGLTRSMPTGATDNHATEAKHQTEQVPQNRRRARRWRGADRIIAAFDGSAASRSRRAPNGRLPRTQKTPALGPSFVRVLSTFGCETAAPGPASSAERPVAAGALRRAWPSALDAVRGCSEASAARPSCPILRSMIGATVSVWRALFTSGSMTLRRQPLMSCAPAG